MAESVDALVSNTNDSNVVPVRPRLRVRKKNTSLFFSEVFFYAGKERESYRSLPWQTKKGPRMRP